MTSKVNPLDFLELCSVGDSASARLALSFGGGVDVNFQHPINKWTALHWASKRGHGEIVRLLLAHGADRHLRDADGRTAADVASHQHVRSLLDNDDATHESEESDQASTNSEFIPNYLANPPFPYFLSQAAKSVPQDPQDLVSKDTSRLFPSQGGSSQYGERKLLRLKVPGVEPPVFKEVVLNTNEFGVLLTSVCESLKLSDTVIKYIVKLPERIVISTDKDVEQLTSGSQIEVVTVKVQYAGATKSLWFGSLAAVCVITLFWWIRNSRK